MKATKLESPGFGIWNVNTQREVALLSGGGDPAIIDIIQRSELIVRISNCRWLAYLWKITAINPTHISNAFNRT